MQKPQASGSSVRSEYRSSLRRFGWQKGRVHYLGRSLSAKVSHVAANLYCGGSRKALCCAPLPSPAPPPCPSPRRLQPPLLLFPASLAPRPFGRCLPRYCRAAMPYFRSSRVLTLSSCFLITHWVDLRSLLSITYYVILKISQKKLQIFINSFIIHYTCKMDWNVLRRFVPDLPNYIQASIKHVFI